MSFSASPHLTQAPRGETHDQQRSNIINKMLASTMQFSNNNPHTRSTPHTGALHQQGKRRQQLQQPQKAARCLLFQDPTVCQHQLAATNPHHSSPPPKGSTYSTQAGTTTGTIR